MRQWTFLLASLALAATLILVERSDDLGAFVRALLANLAVVTWSSFVLPIRGLPRFEEYYELRGWERSGRIYDWLGVPFFRAVVRRGPLSIFNRALPDAWHSGEPERIEQETRTAEAAHAVAFLIVVALAAFELVRGEVERSLWLLIIVVPMNLYPVLLQREHRLRLGEKLRRGELEPAETPRGTSLTGS